MENSISLRFYIKPLQNTDFCGYFFYRFAILGLNLLIADFGAITLLVSKFWT